MALLKRLFIVAALSASIVQQPSIALAQSSLEYQVKAAYVLNFTKFIEWPPTAFDGATDPMRVCIAGHNPFGDLLERTLSGERFETHSFTVEVIADQRAASGCHVLFVSEAEGQSASQWIHASDGPMLTIGEQRDFLQLGGAISFLLESGHVRFDVNPAAAAARGLQISSRLLRVAHGTTGSMGAGS